MRRLGKWKTLRCLGIASLLVVPPGVATTADALTINNGGAPPEPGNVFDSGTYDEIEVRDDFNRVPTVVEISGTASVNSLVIGDSSVAHVQGGTIAELLLVTDNGEAMIRGGQIDSDLVSDTPGALLVIYGSLFELDGLPPPSPERPRPYGDGAIGFVSGILESGDLLQTTVSATRFGLRFEQSDSFPGWVFGSGLVTGGPHVLLDAVSPTPSIMVIDGGCSPSRKLGCAVDATRLTISGDGTVGGDVIVRNTSTVVIESGVISDDLVLRHNGRAILNGGEIHDDLVVFDHAYAEVNATTVLGDVHLGEGGVVVLGSGGMVAGKIDAGGFSDVRNFGGQFTEINLRDNAELSMGGRINGWPRAPVEDWQSFTVSSFNWGNPIEVHVTAERTSQAAVEDSILVRVLILKNGLEPPESENIIGNEGNGHSLSIGNKHFDCGICVPQPSVPTRVEIDGDTLELTRVVVDESSSVDLLAGSITDYLILEDRSTAQLTGGDIQDKVMVTDNAFARLDGTTLHGDIAVRDSGFLEWHSGRIDGSALVSGRAVVEVRGSEFSVNGQGVGLGTVQAEEGVLEGIFESGESFQVAFERHSRQSTSPTGRIQGTIRLVPEPSAAASTLAALATILVLRARRTSA